MSCTDSWPINSDSRASSCETCLARRRLRARSFSTVTANEALVIWSSLIVGGPSYGECRGNLGAKVLMTVDEAWVDPGVLRDGRNCDECSRFNQMPEACLHRLPAASGISLSMCS